MKSKALGLCLAAVCLWASIAMAQEPSVRTSLSPQNGAWVGQRIVLILELLVPGFFSGTPAFDLPHASSLLIVPPFGSPTVSTETIDNISHSVQRYEFSVLPQGAGEHRIPPLTVRLNFKRQPLDPNSVAAVLKTDAIPFAAKSPPGAENLGTVLSAQNLTATEEWIPTPGKAKAGDAFTRRVTFKAPDIPAIALPPFPAAPVDGLGIYPKGSEVSDQADRGNLIGHRIDTVIYICKRPGHYVIPGARLTWWDLGSQTLQVINFPEQSLNVAENPALLSEAPAAAKTGKWNRRILLGIAIAAAILGTVIRFFWHPFTTLLRPTHLAPLNPGRVTLPLS